VTSNQRRTGTASTTSRQSRHQHPLYSALIGLAVLGVLLQGLWAGLFVREGRDYQQNWVEVHALDGEVTIALAALATVAAFVFLRHRRELVVGSAVLTVLLVVEAYIGGRIGGTARLTAVHFPLALALMGLAVYLSLRSMRRG
jgi:heme A synthase